MTTTARRPRSQWVLPEDGIVDQIAVEFMVKGTRRVPLTPGERLAAAALILAKGGTVNRVARRLHIGHRTARNLSATLTEPASTHDFGAAA